MRRREFLVCGAVAAWPFAARAQQSERVRRVGVLMGVPESDPKGQPRINAFRRGLRGAGWIEDRNLQLAYRWAGANIGQMQTFARELVAFQPDVILCHNTRPVAALVRETRTVPIVFVAVADPVGSGFVASMSSGGNVTGFTNHEPSLAGKWLELLEEIAPWLMRVALLFNPETAPQGGAFFSGPFEAAAPAFAVQPMAVPVRSAPEIEPALAALSREPNSGCS